MKETKKSKKKLKKKSKPKSKDTKIYKAKELRRLMKKCYTLWSQVVRKRAGNRCEFGEFYGTPCSAGFLNAHHIEDKRNKALRFEPANGLCGCPGHHKFYDESGHKSFVSVYKYMSQKRLADMLYLIDHVRDKVELTKEYLEGKVLVFEGELNSNPNFKATGQEKCYRFCIEA